MRRSLIALLAIGLLTVFTSDVSAHGWGRRAFYPPSGSYYYAPYSTSYYYSPGWTWSRSYYGYPTYYSYPSSGFYYYGPRVGFRIGW